MRHSKMIALLLAAALLLCMLTGCGEKPAAPPSATPTAQTGGEETYAYVPSYQELPEDLDSVCDMAGGKLYYTTYGITADRTPTAQELEDYGSAQWLFHEYGMLLWTLDPATGTSTRLPGYQRIVGEPKEGMEADSYTNCVCVNADGSLVTLDTVSYYSTTQEDRYEQYAYLRTLDATGAETSCIPLDFVGEGKTIEYPGSFAQDGQGRYYLSDYNNNLVVMDAAGQLLFQLTAAGWLDSLVRLSDGRMAAIVYENGSTVKVIDAEAKAWGENIDLLERVNHVYNGSGDYLLYFADQNQLYGIQAATGETETLLNFIDCNITADYVTSVLTLPSGALGVVSRNSSTRIHYFITLTLTPSSQIPARETLTMACFSPSAELTEAVVTFNIQNPAYRIRIEDYSQYNTDTDEQAGITRLNNDILSGKIPDLLDTFYLNTELYIQKGMVEDLTPYFEADPALSLDGLMPCYVRAASIDGKLYQAYSTFGISTVAGLSSVVGATPGWTWEDLYALQAANPETPLFSKNITQSDMLTLLSIFNLPELVDWEAGTCDFQSPKFLSLLEFAKQFPASYTYNDEDEYTAILNGKQLLTLAHVGSWDMLGQYNSLFGGDVTYIGYPGSAGAGSALVNQSGGSMCICSASAHKDAAWSFIKTLFDQNYQERIARQNGFATLQSAFEAAKAAWIEDNIRYDANGNLISSGAMAWGDSSILELYPPTEAQIDDFCDLIAQVETSYTYDQQALAIISEEAGAFFAGKCTAEAAAAIIQSRMSIYVSEQL